MYKEFAIVFPGQGSQSIGMLNALAENYQQIKTTYQEASEVLGYDLWQLIQEGSEEQLSQTIYTQPAVLVGGVAVWRILQQETGIQPRFLAGHSLGEYTALICAQALEFTAGVKLVAERARLMQEAVPEGQGAMAAIVGLTDEQVGDLCNQVALGEVIAPVNYNAIGQVVIAGNIAAVSRAVEQAKSIGAKIAKRLPVSVPSHCVLMKGAADKLATYLKAVPLQSPHIPVLHNVDVCSYFEVDDIRNALVRQLYNPVRWVETVQKIDQNKVKMIIECGPGKILTGLNKRIISDNQSLATTDILALNTVLDAIQKGKEG